MILPELMTNFRQADVKSLVWTFYKIETNIMFYPTGGKTAKGKWIKVKRQVRISIL